MRKSNLPFLALFLIAISPHAQADQPLRLIKTVFLPGYVGDFEHFAADLKGNRLFLIAEDHKTVEVLDIRTGRRIHTIAGFGQPHAIEYLAGPNSLVVTEGDEESGAVDLVSGSTYKILDKIKLHPDVDGGVYNPVNKYYYVESAGQGPDAKTHLLSIIDTQGFKLVGEITLRGKVLPIGGLKEKLLAAHRQGIFELVLPKDNEKDLPEIPENIRKDMKLHFVTSMDEVLKIALEREIVALPLPGGPPPTELTRGNSEERIAH